METTRRPGTCKSCRLPEDVNRHGRCRSCESELAKWNTKLAADGLKTVKGRQYVKGNGVKARVAKPRARAN